MDGIGLKFYFKYIFPSFSRKQPNSFFNIMFEIELFTTGRVLIEAKHSYTEILSCFFLHMASLSF